MSLSNGMEEYYQKVIHLQEQLRQSEEERLKLEMKFNEMLQMMKEEEEAHFKKLRNKYKQFLEEDRRRQQRNDKILEALDRIENRTVMWEAKTEKFKGFRRKYKDYLKYASGGRNLSPLDTERMPSCNQKSNAPLLENKTISDQDSKEDIMEKYLQSLSSQKCKDDILQKSSMEKPPPESKYSNLGNINSVYVKNANSAEKSDLEKLNRYRDDFDTPQLKTTKDLENSLKQNSTSISVPKKYDYFDSGICPHIDDSNGFANSQPSAINNSHRDYTILDKPDSWQQGNTYEIFDNQPQELNESSEQVHNKLERLLKQHKDESTVNQIEPLQKASNAQEILKLPVNTAPMQEQYQSIPKQRVEELSLNTIQLQKSLPVNIQLVEEQYPSISKQHQYNVEQPQKSLHDNTQPKQKQHQPVPKQLFDGFPSSTVNNNENYIAGLTEHKDPEKIGGIKENLNDHQIAEVNGSQPASNRSSRRPSEAGLQKYETPYRQSHQRRPSIMERVGDTGLENQNKVLDQVNESEERKHLQPQDEDNQSQPLHLLDKDEQQKVQDDLEQMGSQLQQQYDLGSQPLQPSDQNEESLQENPNDKQPLEPQYDTNEQFDSNAQLQQQYVVDEQVVQQYDENNEQSLQEYDEGGQYAQQYYDENGQPLQQYDENDQPLQQYYEENGQPLQNYAGNEQFQSQYYDENGQPLQQYDKNGQPLQKYDKNDQPLQQYYDNGGQPLQQYDENGQPTLQFDQNGQNGHPVTEYDENGQPYVQYDQNFQPQFDDNGQPVTQHDANGQLIAQYDENGQLLPQYDENGQLVSQYDVNGQQLGQYYDQNVPPIQYYEGGESAQQYDENGQPIQQQYDEQSYGNQQQYYDQQQDVVQQEQPEEVKPKVMDMLDTDTESARQDTKVSNDSDFDFSNE